MNKILSVAAALLFCFSSFAQNTEQPEYGYKQTGFQSLPKFGGYIIGSYKYTDKDGANGGPGFG